jgi:acyl-CoA synthetase (AMP-forming)/AMP-acid ligase II
VASSTGGSPAGRNFVGSGLPITSDATSTQRLVYAAAVYGDSPALIPEPPAEPCSFASLASIVQRAAAGLAWRGLRPRDVVGIYVPDVVSFLLARHAISAAGGVPCLVSTQLDVTEMAGQLADCGARMLLTAPPLAAAGLAAADRSWVRQVISFGEAPAATPFSSLLSMGTLCPPAARPHDLALLAYARAADRTLQPVGLPHVEMAGRLADLAATAQVGPGDVVLAAPPTGDGRAYTAFADHVLLHGASIVAAGVGAMGAAAAEYHGTAAIVPPGVTVQSAPELRFFTVV